MDWTKHAKAQAPIVTDLQPKRIPVTVSVEMQKVMKHFREQHPSSEFSETGILATFLEAGVRAYLEDFAAKKRAQVADLKSTPATTQGFDEVDDL